jgi:hypothetical protein
MNSQTALYIVAAAIGGGFLSFFSAVMLNPQPEPPGMPYLIAIFTALFAGGVAWALQKK